MKKFIYILFAVWACCSCQDDEKHFHLSMPEENLSFQAVPGGAVMYYQLPSSTEILYIRVRYKDAFGQDMIRTGSYANDSLLLVGFNEAQQEVRAYVTLCNSDDMESEPIEVTFNTRDSGPISFFDELDVVPGWSGFFIQYNIPEDANGIAHIFYIGEDPISKQPDTLLINSFVLTKGADTLQYSFQQIRDSYDIVIRTEDFRGYMVKEKVWSGVKPYEMVQLSHGEFDFYDPENLSIEDPDYNLGKSYLFDGDLKGESCLEWPRYDNFCTYLAGPYATNKPLFIIDLKEQKLPAEIRLYGMLYVRGTFPWGINNYYPVEPYGLIWTFNYSTKLPSSVTLYGSNNMNDDTSWEAISHFTQDRTIDNELRWCARCNDANSDHRIQTQSALALADPCYLRLSCPAVGKKYRYLKLVVHEVFRTQLNVENGMTGINDEKYTTLHELEIFTEKTN